jgi:hypothetical protein
MGYPKSENFYESVQDKCNRARRCGRIPFSAIRDDGVSKQGGEPALGYESPAEYIELNAKLENRFWRAWHTEQPVRVAVLCEAAGMVPMLERAARRYRVGVASSSGFDSLTAKYDLYREAFERYWERGQPTLLLHFGDHDPSGVSLHESMAEDFAQFALDEGADGIVEVRRVALTPDQVAGLGIETDPEGVKPTDSRSKAFIARGLEPAAQLEAVAPDVLMGMVRDAIEDALDMDALGKSRERERKEHEEVQKTLDKANAALAEALSDDEL